jgi:hypothetical protein
MVDDHRGGDEIENKRIKNHMISEFGDKHAPNCAQHAANYQHHFMLEIRATWKPTRNALKHTKQGPYLPYQFHGDSP